MNEQTNSEALPFHELLAILNSRQRVKFEFGWYYPQWRLPIIPLWFNYMGAHECSVSFTTLEDAVGYFKPSEKPIIYSANAIAQTPPTAIDLPRLVRQSYFGTVRLTIGCMDRMCQVTYYNDKREKQDIRGTSQEVADHINSLPNTPAQEGEIK